jgi:hypothetical protein
VGPAEHGAVGRLDPERALAGVRPLVQALEAGPRDRDLEAGAGDDGAAARGDVLVHPLGLSGAVLGRLGPGIREGGGVGVARRDPVARHPQRRAGRPERRPEVHVVEERRRLGLVAPIGDDVVDRHGTGRVLPLAAQLERAVGDDGRQPVDGGPAVVDHAVQRVALRRRADVAQPARGHQPAAPGEAEILAGEVVERRPLAHAGQPGDRGAGEPRCAAVQRAVRQQPDAQPVLPAELDHAAAASTAPADRRSSTTSASRSSV